MQEGPTLNEMRAKLLLARGVPPEFANEIESWALRGSFAQRKKATFGKRFLSLVITLAIVAIVGLVLSALNTIPERLAREAAAETGATLIFYVVAWGPILASLSAVFMVQVGFWLIEDPYFGRHRAAKGLWQGFGLPGFYTRPVIRAVRPTSQDVDEFLIRFRKRDLLIRNLVLGVASALIVLASLAITYAEANSFLVVGPRGLLEQHYSNGPVRTTHALADVIRVETGCDKSGRRGSNWTIRYRLQLKDGHSFEIGNGKPLEGSRLNALEAIAAVLPSTTAYTPAPGLRDRIGGCIDDQADGEQQVAPRMILLLDPRHTQLK